MSETHRLRSIDSALNRFSSQYRVPAIGASIVQSDGEAISHVVGVRRRDSRYKARVSDKWHIGSCTKSITAALWARLVELGFAEWDTPLPEIFEGLRSVDPGWTDVTIRHALQCRAGFPPNVRRSVFKSSCKDTRPLPVQRSDVVEQALQRPPISFDRFVYSNLSYIVVGSAIDRVAKMSFEDALELYVLQPLGVLTAGYGAPEEICGHRPRVNLRGTSVFRGPPTSPDDPGSDNPRVFSSAGTLHLSLDDWSTSMKSFLAGNDRKLLHEESLETIFCPVVQPGYCMAMGWMQSPRSLGISYFMQGSNTLWSATSMLALDRKRCVLVACNDGRPQILNRCVPLALHLLTL